MRNVECGMMDKECGMWNAECGTAQKTFDSALHASHSALRIPHSAFRTPPSAFTLIEILTVVIIIGLLAALTAGAIVGALVPGNNAAIATDLVQLDLAVKNFYLRFHVYPPDFHDPALARSTLKRMFPRCPEENYPDFTGQSPASALPFWLGGPDGNGFSANPMNPFDSNASRIGPFFEFDPGRLKIADNVRRYYPPRVPGMTAPYVYFRAEANGYEGQNPPLPPGEGGIARPYRDTRTNNWVNPRSYQILCAGLDGQFGAGQKFPSGEDYDAANRDDLTNFSGSMTLEKARP
jgi:prepilin-type N-terminal cleavage/methylation domain-containing protein